MPPFLLGGAPCNRPIDKLRLLPQIQRFCDCDECAESITVDPSNGVSLRGRYLSGAEYKRHRAELDRRRVARFRLGDLSPPRPPTPVVADAAVPLRSLVSPTIATPPVTSPEAPSSGCDTQHRALPLPLRGAKAKKARKLKHSAYATRKPSNHDRATRDFVLPRKLREIQANFRSNPLKDIVRQVAATPLVFITPPTSVSTRASASDPVYALEPASLANKSLMSYEEWLKSSKELVLPACHASDTATRLLAEVLSRLISKDEHAIARLKRDQWECGRQAKIAAKGLSFVSDDYRAGRLSSFEPITFMCYIMASVLYVLCGVSMDHVAFVLACLKIILRLTMADSPNALGPRISLTLPGDVRTIVSSLFLSPTPTAYVCCPKCFALYLIGDPTSYPERCTNRATPSSDVCGRRLRKSSNKPTRQFLYHGLDHWLARLHGNPKLEDAIDVKRSPPESPDAPMHDLWDAPGLYEIKGSDGLPFYRSAGSESRVMVGLNMDGFNALGNKIAGKKHSVIGIYLVCLNLPRAIRYDLENMFLVGVVPGPDEPSKEEINHILRPLVDDLIRLYDVGVYLTKTAKYPHGRLVRVALGPVICDLPAATQIAGFAGHSSSHFCHQCTQTLENKNDLNYQGWTPRTRPEHFAAAQKWKAAQSPSEREDIFNKSGVRYSELLRLNYWDPIKYTVIDSMHCFYLRLFHRHCREIWGMHVNIPDGPGITFDNMETLSEEGAVEARRVLKTCSTPVLGKLGVGLLRWLCRDCQLPFGGTKKQLVAALGQYRSIRGWPTADNADNTNVAPPASNTSPEAMLSDFGDLPFAVPAGVQAPHAAPTSSVRDDEAVRNAVAHLSYTTKSNKALDRLNKEDLLDICAVKIAHREGKTRDHYKAMSPVQVIKDLIREFRTQDGIIDEDGSVIQRPEAVDPKTKEAVARLSYATKTTPSLEKLKKEYLVDICVFNLAPRQNKSREFYQKLSPVQAIKDLIRQYREADGIIDKDGNLIRVSPRSDLPDKSKLKLKKAVRTRVLGKHTLEEVRKDMERLVVPTWFNKAPPTPGQAKRGKYTADQWKAFCTVNLPITLTRLWGAKPVESSEYRALSNFMNLVTAVKLATARTITAEGVKQYEECMHNYLTGLLELYPGTSISPYQHLALHFGSFLRRFGPTHAWRCFPFERYNRVLQQIPTNNHYGEREITMFTRFCMMQNLRSIFHNGHLPFAASDIIPDYDKIFRTDTRGTFLGDNLVFTEDFAQEEELVTWTRQEMVRLSNASYRLLKSWILNDPDSGHSNISQTAFPRSQISRLGHRFEPIGQSFANSQIIYHQSNSGLRSAGQIERIFTHTRTLVSNKEKTETFLLIKPYAPLPEPSPHATFQSNDHILLDRLLSEPVLVSIGQVQGHFAFYKPATRMEERQCIIALPLERN